VQEASNGRAQLAQKLGAIRGSPDPEPANPDQARTTRAPSPSSTPGAEHRTREQPICAAAAAEVARCLDRDDALARLMRWPPRSRGRSAALDRAAPAGTSVEQQDFAGRPRLRAGGREPTQLARRGTTRAETMSAGAFDRAARPTQGCAADPELAEREGIVDRMAAVQARGAAVP
jgi:hypothetical protein